jgi:hypothetical protein
MSTAGWSAPAGVIARVAVIAGRSPVASSAEIDGTASDRHDFLPVPPTKNVPRTSPVGSALAIDSIVPTGIRSGVVLTATLDLGYHDSAP